MASRGLMVFEEIIRHSPRRRALHSIAEGFSPTARAHTGGISQSPSARTRNVAPVQAGFALESRGVHLTEVGFSGSSCVTSPVSGIRTPELPLLPLWEKGAGGMRGKSARNTEHRSSLPKTLHLRAGGMRGKSAPEYRKSLISPKKSTLERRGSPRRHAAHTGLNAQSS